MSAMRFRALGHAFAVVADDPALAGYLARLLAPFAVDEPVPRAYTIAGPDPSRGTATLSYDGAVVLADATPPHVLATLLWHVNAEVLARTPDAVLLHAAAAELDGTAVVLPAVSGSGKTTLVAGLVRAGMRYLTDEAVAVDPHTLTIAPFAKPLSIDPGSFAVLADLEPAADEAPPWTAGPLQWHLTPDELGADRLAGPARPGVVVTPRYEAGAPVRLEPLTPGETLLVLADNTFAFHDARRRNLQVLAGVAERTRGYRLTGGDLDECVAAVLAICRAPVGAG